MPENATFVLKASQGVCMGCGHLIPLDTFDKHRCRWLWQRWRQRRLMKAAGRWEMRCERVVFNEGASASFDARPPDGAVTGTHVIHSCHVYRQD